jgi:excinuclease ABC subunit C
MLVRRLKHPEWKLPQILVVDGSTAQKNAAERILTKLELVIPVVAVVKDEHHKPIRLIASKKLLATYQSDILLANAESHRFALSFHKKLRGKRLLASH